MAASYQLSQDALTALFTSMRADGKRILAPVARNGRTEFAEVAGPGEMAMAGPRPVLSAKDTVFPKVERMLSYRTGTGTVALADAEPAAKPTVLLVRPCEAKAFRALDAVFNWDSRDRFFNARMEQLTVVAVGCLEADEACFCTSVGGSPMDTEGADLFLLAVEGGWYAEAITPRGEALAQLAPAGCAAGNSVDKAALAAQVPVRFDHRALTARLGGMFEHPVWKEQSLRCIGCGACAYVCPTCACFDLQEEADPCGGQRLRCWDSCGFRMFTLHASGHNPREQQSARWRQRVYHKFAYYPDRFGMLGCVGCGKCTRACPVDMNLAEHLTHAEEVEA